MRWGGRCGRGSLWPCLLKSFRGLNSVKSSERSMPTKRRCIKRPNPDAPSPHGATREPSAAPCWRWDWTPVDTEREVRADLPGAGVNVKVVSEMLGHVDVQCDPASI